MDLLQTYAWPGNVRELENVIERAMLLSEDGVIHGYHLPPSLQAPVVGDSTAPADGLEARLGAIEYELIVEALKLHHGNMTEAAAHLGLTRRVLGLRMGKYHLNYKDYR